MKNESQCIHEENFEQIFSYDFHKERAETLEGELYLAKMELSMVKDMEKFWYESYERLNKEFIKYLDTR